jgi:hypothetical protein
MTRTTSSTENPKLALLGTAKGKPANSTTRKVTVVGAQWEARTATEGTNKRDGDTISTSSESRAHVDRKARVETGVSADTRANLVSPQGKEKTLTDKDDLMEENERELDSGMTISLEDEEGIVKETKNAPSNQESDQMEVDP